MLMSSFYQFFFFLAACPTVIVPAKVVQALNLNFDDMGGLAQPRFNSGFASDHGRPIFSRLAQIFTHPVSLLLS